MHTITLLPFNVRLLAHEDETVFHTIRRHGYPIASSCDGDGVCDKCRLRIVAGADNVTAPNDTERRFMRERSFDDGERMACQIRCTGDISVRTTYW
ncbi:MAG: (2Fe-2S)-binding protein [Ignavibacteriae bacterium]|nr:(2Fe-2S)-binding protein [Ignavibacteriota bacterium]